MTTVLDASALLARLKGETGAGMVEEALLSGARCGAANWSEAAQKMVAAGRRWNEARALLMSYQLRIEPVTLADAEWAAHRWRPQEGLSLADRLCLALGERLDAVILTADRSRGTGARLIQIR
ncbi:PIN domain-containing protein [Candidatus Poriferisodalis sp.]|uniref:PIN domain-containing protein n=1 Tax=Candidatus Poriferisodalis sp. TaxID=3101277 RepID=UPI003B528F58